MVSNAWWCPSWLSRQGCFSQLKPLAAATGMGPKSFQIAGLRLWSFFTKEKSWFRPEPRIIISQLLEGKKRVQFGMSVSNQGLHQLSNVNGILPGDIWFPSGSAITPQRTTQISGAYMQPLFAGTELSGELYYKSFKGITDLTGIEEDPLLPNYWERSITQGVGNSYGFELLLSKKTGIVTGIASYSYTYLS